MGSTKSSTLSAPLLVAALAAAFAAVGCAPSKTAHQSQRTGSTDPAGKTTDNVASTNPQPPPQKDNGNADDLSVEIAVPMGLVDPAYVASAGNRIPAALLPDKPTFDYCQNPPSPALPPQIAASINYAEWTECPTGVDVPYAYERGVTSEPAGQIHDTRAALLRTQAMMAQFLGAGSYFGTSDLKVLTSGGKGSRRFALPAVTGGRPYQFAEVSYVKGATYPYVIDLFEQLLAVTGNALPDCALGGKLLRSVRLEFARPTETSKEAKVHIQDFHIDPDFPTYCKYSEITYDTATDVIDFVESWDHLAPAVQNKYMTTIEYTPTNAIVTGAIRWNLSDHPEIDKQTDPRADRSEYALQDDTDVFRAVALITGDHETKSVQELASIPGDQHDQWAGKTPDASIFTTNPYDQVEWDHLLRLLRDPTLNAACTTAGTVLKGKYASASGPSSAVVTAAPANLCLANTAFARADAERLVSTICLLAPSVSYSLGVVDGDGDTGNLCEQYDRIVALRNPQTIEIVQVTDPADATKQVYDQVEHLYHTAPSEMLTHVAYDTDYASLEAALGLGTRYPDLVTLWSDAKWDVPVPAADDFKGAETLTH